MTAQRKQMLLRLTESALSLMVVFLLLAATAVSAGKFFGHPIASGTDGESAQGKAAYTTPTADLLEKMGLTGCTLTEKDTAVWVVVDAQGQTRGTLISTEKSGKDLLGFAGPTPLLVLVGNAGTMETVEPLPNNETPDYFERAKTLLGSLTGKKTADIAGQNVNAVSGATFSSKALIGNVKAALATYEAGTAETELEPVIGWAKTCAALLVVLLGLLASWRLRGNKAARIAVLVMNVCVLGFWTGQFISLTLIRGWMINGVDVIGMLPAVIIVVLAFVLPLLGRKKHYCVWICPYGSLQELAFLLPLPKIKVSGRVMKWLRRLQISVLMLLLAFLWFGIGTEMLDYEPFAAFMVNSAPTVTIILAAAFIILGMFVPRLWCHSLCPVGMLLNLAEDAPATKKINQTKE